MRVSITSPSLAKPSLVGPTLRPAWSAISAQRFLSATGRHRRETISMKPYAMPPQRWIDALLMTMVETHSCFNSATCSRHALLWLAISRTRRGL